MSERIVLNVSAGEDRRNPSEDQLTFLIHRLRQETGSTIVLVGAPETVLLRKRLAAIGEGRCLNYPTDGSAPFMDMVSLIRRSHMLISPDTSLVHVASAVGVPVCAMFSSEGEIAEWSPVGVQHESIADRTSGNVRSIPALAIFEAFMRLRSRIRPA